MTINKKQGFYITVTCPGCGAGLQLDSNFYVLSCDYCNSVLRIVMPDLPPVYLAKSRVKESELKFAIDRYLKENNLPLTDSDLQIKKIYYPFWKVDATILKVRNKIHEKLVAAETEHTPEIVTRQDKTSLNISPYSVTVSGGAKFRGIPESLGIRSESIEVEPFSNENIEEGFDALPVVKPWQQVWANVSSSVAIVGDIGRAGFGKNLTEMFYPEFSVIYFPYFVCENYSTSHCQRYIVDGISNRVVDVHNPLEEYMNEVPEDIIESSYKNASHSTISIEQSKSSGLSKMVKTETNETVKPVKMEFGDLKVEFHRCHNCGVDLPEEKSFVYICRNCKELSTLEKNIIEIENLLTCDYEPDQNDMLLPFWSVTLPENKIKKMRFIFGGLFNSDSIVVPAFSSRNFDAVLRLARRMSYAKNKFQLKPVNNFKENYHNVEISLKEAIQLASLTLYREYISKFGKSKDGLEEINPRKVELIYLPFHLKNYFYLDSVLNSVTLEKRMIED